MRYTAKLAGAGLVLVFATACGGHTTTAKPATSDGAAAPSGSASPSTAPSGSPSASPGAKPPESPHANPPGKPRLEVPEGSTPVPPGKLDVSALPSGFPHEAYTANGGAVLNIRAQEGGCGHALGSAIEQTAQRVVVDLSETKAQTGQMCTMDIRYPVISVPLAAPLGERTVVLKHSPPK
ncbi:hypothetical protein [Amycolatopsis samaneae]|uniref:Lipoprotein n=1 Tax=Amycolatopsis samaneae TaxID=664691 RepID=A0ABW5GBW3_9PSEU